jgi:hypothetical protein
MHHSEGRHNLPALPQHLDGGNSSNQQAVFTESFHPGNRISLITPAGVCDDHGTNLDQPGAAHNSGTPSAKTKTGVTACTPIQNIRRVPGYRDPPGSSRQWEQMTLTRRWARMADRDEVTRKALSPYRSDVSPVDESLYVESTGPGGR